jgi:hypothetical protein
MKDTILYNDTLRKTKKDVLLLSMRKGWRKIKRRENVNMWIKKDVPSLLAQYPLLHIYVNLFFLSSPFFPVLENN